MNTQFRPCGECTACCKGHLKSTIHGNIMTPEKPCIFLVKEKCSIYENRPEVCRNYFCAWSQGILDHDMRPDKCGLLVSVNDTIDYEKNNLPKKHLTSIEIHNSVKYEFHQKLDKCAKRLNTFVKRITFKENIT